MRPNWHHSIENFTHIRLVLFSCKLVSKYVPNHCVLIPLVNEPVRVSSRRIFDVFEPLLTLSAVWTRFPVSLRPYSCLFCCKSGVFSGRCVCVSVSVCVCVFLRVECMCWRSLTWF